MSTDVLNALILIAVAIAITLTCFWLNVRSASLLLDLVTFTGIFCGLGLAGYGVWHLLQEAR